MNRERLLAVLYDLALVVGSEVHLRPLLTKTLQRLLYHTSFPAGAIFIDLPPDDGSGKIVARLELAIGDHQLASHAGTTLSLPTNLICGGMALEEERSLIDALPCRQNAYAAMLRLPIDEHSVAILLSPEKPETDLPLTQLFQPVMANLAKAILLCRRNEAYTSAIISDRDRAQSNLERFRAALDASADSVFLIDPVSMKLVDFNLSAEASSGYRRDKLLEMGAHELMPEYSHGRLSELFRTLLQGKSSNLELDTIARRKDGGGYPAAIRFNLFAHGNEEKLIIAIARDVTERKRLETQLHQLNEGLERRVAEEVAKNREKDHLLIQQSRLAAMGEMIHNIAHQWRQPLNTLVIMLANIQDQFNFSELTAESLDQSIRDANVLLQRMSTTIDDFRNFFRPDQKPAEFNIAEAVENALFIMAASLKNSHIEIEKNLSQDIKITGFFNQFSQAVLNLLANAKEAIQQHNIPEGKIEITLEQADGNAVLAIHDNAGGIPPDIISKIFDPYFTTKDQGSGIGLYMSKMIIARNFKGKIQATNSGSGALVTITIPLNMHSLEQQPLHINI